GFRFLGLLEQVGDARALFIKVVGAVTLGTFQRRVGFLPQLVQAVVARLQRFHFLRAFCCGIFCSGGCWCRLAYFCRCWCRGSSAAGITQLRLQCVCLCFQRVRLGAQFGGVGVAILFCFLCCLDRCLVGAGRFQHRFLQVVLRRGRWCRTLRTGLAHRALGGIGFCLQGIDIGTQCIKIIGAIRFGFL